MFTGGMSQGIINGLEATQVSADRAEMIRSRKLDNEKKEAEDDDWGAIPAFLRRSKVK